MAYNHISLNADQYNLFLENTNTEDELSDGAPSSASNFSVLLTPQIDLASLLYLRSVRAELAISSLIVDNLPLCFTERETIKVHVIIPTIVGTANQVINTTAISNDNNKSFQLGLHDLCTSQPQTAIDYINDKLRYNVNQHLIYRYLKLFFDTDVFKANYTQPFRQSDLILLNQYINIALACRKVLHNTLSLWLGTDDDITNTITLFKPENVCEAATETRTLRNSRCLKPLANREVLQGHIPVINFTLFYGIDVSQETEKNTADTLGVVKGNILDWLHKLRLLTRKPDGTLTDSNTRDLTDMVTSNKQLIELGLKARAILGIQQNQVGGNIRPERDIFNSNVLGLSIDNSGLKCKFYINHNIFLCDDGTTLEVEFPEHMSYVLGSRSNKGFSVGPVSANTALEGGLKVTDNNIYHVNQRLPSSICPMPKMIFVATDIVSAQSRDLWLRSTPFADYHLVYSQVLDERSIRIRMICKCNVDTVFYKIQRINNVLEQFSVKLLDHNFKPILFPFKTYTKIALIIKPAPIESY